MRRIFVLTLMTLGVWFGLPMGAPAYAVDACDTLVIDRTSDRVLGDTLEIESAALRLENLGIDVRVRAFETEPSGGFNTYQKQQVQSCSSWQGPDGFTKGNLVTYLFSMDQKSYIFYGSNLEAELDGNIDRIRAERMNEGFRRGDFEGGITDAMAETAKAVEAYNNPEPSGPTVVNNEPSSGGNALGWVLAVLAAVAAFVGLLFGGFKLIQWRRRRLDELSTARLAAETATKNAATAMTNLDRIDDTERSVELILPLLNEEDQQRLQDLVAKFGELNAQAVQAASDIVDNPSVYSLDKPRKLAEYDRIMVAQDNVIRLAEEAGAIMRQLDEMCRRMDQEIIEAPETYQAHQAALVELRDLQDRLRQEGYRLDNLDEDFSGVEVLLDRAKRELDAKRHGHALDELRESEQLLDSLRVTLARVPEWRQSLQESHVALTTELERVESIAATALAMREEIEAHYTSCESDLLSEREIESLLRLARSSLQSAAEAFSMDRQQWEVADQHLTSSENGLNSLQQSSEAIAGRADKLNSLVESLPTRFDRLETDIIKMGDAIDDRKGEQKKFERKLTACSENLTQLRRAFEESRPDLLSINTDLTSLEARVKKIDSDSDDVHDKEVRRLRQNNYSSSSGGSSFGTGVITGSVLGSSGGFDFGGSSGGSSGGSWGGGDGGSSGGSW